MMPTSSYRSRSDCDTLLIAPYVGEFGWELMNWQGRVRRIVSDGSHRHVLVFAEPDRHALYTDLREDPRVAFCPIQPLAFPGDANEDHRIGPDGRKLDVDLTRRDLTDFVHRHCDEVGLDARRATVLLSPMDSSLFSTARAQRFVPLGQRQPISTDVVLVERKRRVAAERNHRAEWWDELEVLLRGNGLRVERYVPRLDSAIRQFARARLAAGASTGGLHLASLCRCPHYVWGSGSEERWTALRVTNRQRYETLWNPLGTRCIYDERGWNPSVAQVATGIAGALQRIGRPADGDRRHRPMATAAWRWKRGLLRLVEANNGRSMCPWRLREFVREHMV